MRHRLPPQNKTAKLVPGILSKRRLDTLILESQEWMLEEINTGEIYRGHEGDPES